VGGEAHPQGRNESRINGSRGAAWSLTNFCFCTFVCFVLLWCCCSQTFTDAAVRVLRRWLQAHLDDPYPDAVQKTALAAETNLSYEQVQVSGSLCFVLAVACHLVNCSL